MKLPEYDNRTPNTPLYDDASGSSDAEGAKFTLMGIVYPLIWLGCFLYVCYEIALFLRRIFS